MLKEILIFGDSLTYGAWDKKGGWAERLREWSDEKFWETKNMVYIYTLGIPGNTTKYLLERFKTEVEARAGQNVYFIFQIGINDSQYLLKEKRNQIPSAQFEKNIEALITATRRYSNNIILLGLTLVDESKVNPMPWDLDSSYQNSHIKRYNKILENICKQQKVKFINFMPSFEKEDYKKYLEDGAHLNNKGHELIFEKVKKEIDFFN